MAIHMCTATRPTKMEETPRSMGAPTIPAEQLFNGASTVFIVHAGDQYKLTITRNDKLILTK